MKKFLEVTKIILNVCFILLGVLLIIGAGLVTNLGLILAMLISGIAFLYLGLKDYLK